MSAAIDAADDDFSVDLLLKFLRDGIEGFDKEGPAAFRDLADLILRQGCLGGGMKQWAHNLETGDHPESAQRFKNYQEAARSLLVEKAQEVRKALKENLPNADQQRTRLFYALLIVDAFKIPESKEIVRGLLAPALLNLWTPEKGDLDTAMNGYMALSLQNAQNGPSPPHR